MEHRRTPADADYCFVPGRLLWSQDDQAGRRRAAVDDFGRTGTLHDAARRRFASPQCRREGSGDRAIESRHPCSASTVTTTTRLLEAMLAIFDDELGEGVVTPEHCPTWPTATDALPRDRTGGDGPERALAAQGGHGPRNAGKSVRVAVIDTGWHEDAGRVQATKYLKTKVDGERETYTPNDLGLYEGHGTFIAGVIKCRAPQARIKHYSIGNGVAAVRARHGRGDHPGPGRRPGQARRTSSTCRRAATPAATAVRRPSSSCGRTGCRRCPRPS